MQLVVCARCGRHVKDSKCPFCGATNGAPRVEPSPVLRAGRAVVMASATAGAVMSLVACYGSASCPDQLNVSAACGFLSITTTCPDASATCTYNARGLATLCTIFPIKANCTISVKLADLTTHDVPVTVTTSGVCSLQIASPTSNPDFTSPTCQAGGPIDAASE